jgi:hypothetical protein
MCLFNVILIIKVRTNSASIEPLIAALSKADQYLYDLHLINAICDPIIYAVRMSEVKLGYRRLFWRLCRLRIRSPREDSFAHSSRFLEQRLSARNSLSRNGTNRSVRSAAPLNHIPEAADHEEDWTQAAYRGHRMTQSGSIFFE